MVKLLVCAAIRSCSGPNSQVSSDTASLTILQPSILLTQGVQKSVSPTWGRVRSPEGDQVVGLQSHDVRVQDLEILGTIRLDGLPDRSADVILQNRQKTSNNILRLPLSSHPYRTLVYTDSPLCGDEMGGKGHPRNLTQGFNGPAGGVVYHLATIRSTPFYILDG